MLGLRVALVAALVAAPGPAAAAPAPTWQQHRDAARARYAQAEQLDATSAAEAVVAYADAARLFAEAAAAVPAAQVNRLATVEPLFRKALVAFAQAHRQPSSDASCSEELIALLGDALATCDAFIAAVDGAPPGADRSRYADVVRTRREYQRDQKLCAASLPAPAPEVKPEAPPIEPDARGEVPAPEAAAPARGSGRLDAGLWTSVAMFGLLGATSLGTGLSRVSGPFQGVAYTHIFDAATASQRDTDPNNDIGNTQSSDMCALARRTGADHGVVNADVAGRCDQRDALGKASIATGALAGLAFIAAVTFLGLKLRRDRQGKALAGRRFWLGPGPARSHGLTLSGSF